MSDLVRRSLQVLRANGSNQLWLDLVAAHIYNINGRVRFAYELNTDFLAKSYENPRFDGDARAGSEQEIVAAGYKVKTGEKGITVLAPEVSAEIFAVFRRLYERPTEYNNAVQGILATYYCGTQVESATREFKPYTNKFRKPLNSEQERQIQLLERIADAFDVRLRHFGDKIAYLPYHKMIAVPTKDHFSHPEKYIQSIAHELIHTTLLEDDPSIIPGQPRFPTIPQLWDDRGKHYALAEWRAELGGLRILDALGVKLDQSLIANSAAYLHSWTYYPSWVLQGELSADERQQMIDQSIIAANTLLQAVDLKYEPSLEQESEIRKLNSTFSTLSGQTAGIPTYSGVMFNAYCEQVIGLDDPKSRALYDCLYAAASDNNTPMLAQIVSIIAETKANARLQEHINNEKQNEVCNESANDFKM